MAERILTVGTKLINNKNIYTILGDNGLKGNNKKYLVHCSICSEDKELFPEIWTRKGELDRGKLSCACSKNYSYSRQQYEVLCKRKCDTLGVTFINVIADQTGKVRHKSKIVFTDLYGETISNMSIEYFLYRYDNTTSKNNIVCDSKYYTEKFKDLFVVGTKFRREGRSKPISVFCPFCSNSDLCVSGITSPWFTASISNVYKGMKPCFCSGHYAYSEKEYEFRIKSQLINGTFNKMIKPFKCNQTKFEWKCDCGYIHTQTIVDFLSGKRCPACASYGFCPDKPATLYVVKWKGVHESFIKVGITNRYPFIRFDEQQKESNCEIIDYKFYQFEIGKHADLLEDLILGSFPKVDVFLDRFEDGKTELLSMDQYDKILKVIDNYEFRSY